MALAHRLRGQTRSIVKNQGLCIALRSLRPASGALARDNSSSVPTSPFFLPLEAGWLGKGPVFSMQQHAVGRVDLQSRRGFAAEGGERAKETGESVPPEQQSAKTEDAGPDVGDEPPVDERFLVLESALKHVAKLGWSEAALVEGARSHGLSPTFVSAFPRGPAELVEHFMHRCTDDLAEQTEERREELQRMLLRERLATIVRMRLEMQAPYISSWPRALSLQAQPQNALKALEQRAHLADDIWRAAGDVSAEVAWYAKRAALSLVYSATEVYMLTDFSPEFRDTWTFLDRQIGTALDLGKSAQELGHLGGTLAAAVPNIMSNLKGPGLCGTKFGHKGREQST